MGFGDDGIRGGEDERGEKQEMGEEGQRERESRRGIGEVGREFRGKGREKLFRSLLIWSRCKNQVLVYNGILYSN